MAVKRLLPELAADPARVRAFHEEARLGSQLHHSHIAAVIDCGVLDGVPVQVLELVDGTDLVGLLELLGTPLPLLAALEIGAAVAEALEFAHRARDEEGRALGIVHRDVAPDNVLVSWGGDIKLVDFGIALAHRRQESTKVGVIKGKLAYMSPEQFDARDVDARADVFGAGGLLHYLLTGSSVIVDRSLEQPGKVSVRPELPPEIVELITRATHPDRTRRFASAAELLEALEQRIAEERRAGNSERLSDLLAGLQRTRVDEPPVEAGPGTMVSMMSRSPAEEETATAEATQLDAYPPVIGGAQILRALSRQPGRWILEAVHAFSGTPRIVVRIPRPNVPPEAFAARAAMLATLSDPLFFPVLDTGVDELGGHYVLTEGPLGEPLTEALRGDRSLEQQWRQEIEEAEEALRRVWPNHPGIRADEIFVRRAGRGPRLSVLPLELWTGSGFEPSAPRATSFLTGPRSVLPGRSRLPPSYLAALLLGLGISTLGTVLVLYRAPPPAGSLPEPPKTSAPAAIAAVETASHAAITEQPSAPPPSPALGQGRRPRPREVEHPLKSEAPVTKNEGPTVERSLALRGLELEDLRGGSVDPALDAYLRARASGDEARMRAASPAILERIAQATVNEALLLRRATRVKASLKAAMAKLSPEDRDRLDRELLDLKTQIEPGLDEARARALLNQLGALERALERAR